GPPAWATTSVIRLPDGVNGIVPGRPTEPLTETVRETFSAILTVASGSIALLCNAATIAWRACSTVCPENLRLPTYGIDAVPSDCTVMVRGVALLSVVENSPSEEASYMVICSTSPTP